MAKEITITRDQYKVAVAKALANGETINDAIKKDAQMGFMIMLAGIPITRDIEEILFGDDEEGK